MRTQNPVSLLTYERIDAMIAQAREARAEAITQIITGLPALVRRRATAIRAGRAQPAAEHAGRRRLFLAILGTGA